MARTFSVVLREGMLDPSIMDLMHHLGRQPPPIVEDAARVPAQVASKTEKYVRRTEIWAEEWVKAVFAHFHAFKSDYDADEDNTQDIPSLDRAISIAEDTVSEGHKYYKKLDKIMRKQLGAVRKALPLQVERYKTERARMLAAHSRLNLAKTEILLGLRAIRAEIDPDFRSGKVFDDPNALGSYLRSIVG